MIARTACIRLKKRYLRVSKLFQCVGRGYVRRVGMAGSWRRSAVYRWFLKHKTAVPTLALNARVASTLILQRFGKRFVALLTVNRRRARFATIIRGALTVQRVFRGYRVRRRWSHVLIEARYLRHEAHLANFLRRCVVSHVPKLSRVVLRAEVDAAERTACQAMLVGCNGNRSLVANCLPTGVSDDGQLMPANLPEREWRHAQFCNSRNVATLEDESTDSDDEAIEDEPLKSTIRPARSMPHQEPHFLTCSVILAERLSHAIEEEVEPRQQPPKLLTRKKKPPLRVSSVTDRKRVLEKLVYGYSLH